jgi:hypothetical protein
MTERDPKDQLFTARLILEQFNAQIEEFDGMNRQDRRGTARGRDLSTRIDGLRDGQAKWAARVTELEERMAREAEEGTDEGGTDVE